MERDNIKVQELIKKQLLEIITQEEEAELLVRKAYYTEEEYDALLIEGLRKLEGQLPKDSLDNWNPDFDAIKIHGEDIRKKRKIKQYVQFGYAAALLLFIGGILLYLFYPHKKEDIILHLEGQCLGIADNTEIPLIESSCFLLATDSTWIRVEQDTFGKIVQLGELAVTRTEEGLLRIQRNQINSSNAPSLKNLEIYTGPRQQCVVELEDGTKIRLNAQSRLSYPLVKRDSTVVYIKGEAYVDAKTRNRSAPLSIGTERGKIMTSHADFLIRSDTSNMKAMLNDGTLEIYSRNLNKTRSIVCPGDFVYIGAKYVGKNQLPRDTMTYVANLDFEEAKMWTRKIRIYRNMPLWAFVDEMSRWEGFTIKRWDCIPKNKLISVSICYQSGREEVYSAIRQAGVLLHEEKGMISFCPEDKRDRVAMRQLDRNDRKLK
ncbi:FecR domain-containing protein [Sphingobacterium sp. DR205]|uniref:FecR domain-containing protein n=1 Tax=Sphingobacterium sp. DR205 TaxID=2713573 RepID=UPI0013E4A8FD|nr:FecR domain-containing protein [Sphingobacterium sp. DR205]QIH35257.1 FecR domain-containing protein [Sphingobacterium sp. DR205]